MVQVDYLTSGNLVKILLHSFTWGVREPSDLPPMTWEGQAQTHWFTVTRFRYNADKIWGTLHGMCFLIILWCYHCMSLWIQCKYLNLQSIWTWSIVRSVSRAGQNSSVAAFSHKLNATCQSLILIDYSVGWLVCLVLLFLESINQDYLVVVMAI